MEQEKIERVLTALIEFFESGNHESDAVAKAIMTADGGYEEFWREEIERFEKSVEWTGLRAPEAEFLAGLLRQAAGIVAGLR